MCVSLLTAFCKKSDLDVQSKSGTFILVEEEVIRCSHAEQYIMYDPDTMVMYSYLGGSHSGGLTVMYNADGTLKLYSPSGDFYFHWIVTDVFINIKKICNTK